MNFLSICVFLVGISALTAHKLPINSVEDRDDVLVKLNDFLKKFVKDENNKVNLEVDGKKLSLEFLGKKKKVPVLVVDDEGKKELDHESEHELYHDKENDATFTISTFKKGDKETRSVRGSVVLDGQEIVVNPAFPKHPKAVKRQAEDDDDVASSEEVEEEEEDEVHVAISRRSLEGRRGPQQPVLDSFRHKRQTGALNTFVETLAVCDYYCYNQHAAYMKTQDRNTVAHHVEGYLTHVMNLADLHYQRTFEKDTQLKIGLYTNAFVILTTSAASKFTTDPQYVMTVNSVTKDATNRFYVNGDKSLQAFNEWLIDQVAGSTIPSFDLAVAFTNANLFTPSADLLGIAPMGGTCQLGRNGVLVEDSGSFASGGTTAHEIAHNLGVAHDTDMGSTACTDEMNYLMSTSNKMTNRINSYYLSACSVNALKTNFLTNKQFQCTYNTVSKQADYNKFISFKPGQIYNADEQCKQQYGPNSKLMTGNKSGGGTFQDDMCATLWCTNDYRSAQTGSAASEGTSCGSGKWCVKGVCTADPAAPTGTCLSPDDDTFCNNFLNSYGMSNVCLNYKNGPCCKMCGGTLIPKLHSVQAWLSGNTLDNVKFLDQVYVAPCADKYTWCPTQITEWKKSIPAICGGGYQVNGEQVTQVCKKSCALC